MISLRRADERRHEQHRRETVWLTFYPRDQADPLADRFGPLESLSERRIPPNSQVLRHLHHETEIVTYVREGAIANKDSTGHSGVIHAGEFQRMTAERTVRRSETNASRTRGAHVFQLWLRCPRAGLESGHEQKRFSVAERRGSLCVVASPDARRGSLRLHQDALVYSALLDPGQHLIHELLPGRSAWLHVVEGEAVLGEFVLSTGDGAGLMAEPVVSLTAQEATEILLLDLG